jgi:hypothetical protein
MLSSEFLIEVMDKKENQEKKLLLIGDENCGKTSLITYPPRSFHELITSTFVTGIFPGVLNYLLAVLIKRTMSPKILTPALALISTENRSELPSKIPRRMWGEL